MDGSPLGEDDLHEILTHLKDVQAQCYNIGTALHLKQDTLETIKQNSANHAEALTKIVNEWLRRNYNFERFGEPTWKALLEAVASLVGGTHPRSPSVFKNGKPQIDEVLHEIRDVDDWRSLGKHLEIESSKLDEIGRCPIEEQKSRMVAVWFECDENCTWENLREALEKTALSEVRVSKKIVKIPSARIPISERIRSSVSTRVFKNGKPQIDEVLHEIRDVDDWRRLGKHLGIESSKLDEIGRCPIGEQKSRMVIAWFECDKNYTWERLREALEKTALSEVRVSRKIVNIPSTPIPISERIRSSTISISTLGEDLVPFTESNVLDAISKIANYHKLGLILEIPPHKLSEIEQHPVQDRRQLFVSALFRFAPEGNCNWKKVNHAISQVVISEWKTKSSSFDFHLSPMSSTDSAALSTIQFEQFFTDVKKHMQKSGSVDRLLAHLVFVGLPCSGKSTLIARLLNIEVLTHFGSTGILDGIITVDLMEDKISMHAANIDEKNSSCDWKQVELGLSCLRQMGAECFVLKKTQADMFENNTPSSPLGESSSLPQRKNTTSKQLDTAKILKLLKKEGFPAVRPYLNNRVTLYLSDTGGQIEFQELLPLLVAGHAIFVFVFPLNIDLDAPVTVSYRRKVVGDKIEHSNVYTSSLTIRDSFLQTLSSIDSMETSSDFSIAKHSPYVIVVGTHKDCLVKELGKEGASQRLVEINSKIKSLVKEHCYEHLVIPVSKDEVVFAVDNTCQNEIFRKLRSCIVDLVCSGDDFRVQFPINYLLASLHLQECNKPFIKRSNFAKEVLPFGIEEDDIDPLLWFLHTRISQIRYFPFEGVREIIVKEPQALYNHVTHLITKSFVSQCATMIQHSEVQRGIYSLDSLGIEKFSESLTSQQTIDLLEKLRIVAPFYDRNAKTKKYFIPCVLNHLREPQRNEVPELSIVQPLAIMFGCGHCPKGMFGVLLHCILTDDKKKLDWNLSIDSIFRNQVSFETGPYEDTVIIKVHTTHLEIRYMPVYVPQRSQAFTVKNICNMIRCTLVSGIKQATKSLHYSFEKTRHSFGLECAKCSKVHKVTRMENQHMMKCPELGVHPVPDPASFWFGIPPTYSLLATSSKVVLLRKGQSHQMVFNVISDPPLLTPHQLTKDDDVEGPCQYHNVTHVYLGKESVCFKNVEESDAGAYAISSSNAAGNGQITFQLKINAPLEYHFDSDYLEAENGNSYTIPFTISDPSLSESTKRKHRLKRSDGTNATKRFKVEGNCISFRNVRVEDSGTYVISCCNDEGEEIEETLELDVTPSQLPAHQAVCTETAPSDIIRSEDINRLMKELYKYAYKWQDIGTALNFHPGELKNIVCLSGADPKCCLKELLIQWSQWPTKDHSDVPTIAKLCDALCSGPVGLGQAAYELHKRIAKD